MPIRGNSGETEQLVAVARDLTHVQLAEEKFRVLFESTADAHLLFDETGLIDCNRAAISMLRYPDKPALLRTPFARLSPDLQPDGTRSDERTKELRRVTQECGEYQFEWTLRPAKR
jgi:PAS domain-containing protein